MTEEKRLQRNQQRIAELFPTFATRLKKVIADLEKAGLRPRIQEGWRSPADQLKAFNSGHSKLKFGFHNVTADDGTPESLAVDMLDDNNPTTPPVSYLLRLAAASRNHGLETGILWGLPAHLKQGVEDAIEAEDFSARVKVGWDPTHIQPAGITVKEAKAGKRPG